jgi:hypothetical protein
MKKLFPILIALLVFALPAIAQATYPESSRGQDQTSGNSWHQKLSPDDQQAFDNEYNEWKEANAKNDRDAIDKHARRMEEIMSRNNIPRDTPFDAVAGTTTGGNGRMSTADIHRYQGKFSPDDQKKFDKTYEHWLDAKRKNNRDDIAKNEGRLQELMAKYNIPRDVPYDALASGGRGY